MLLENRKANNASRISQIVNSKISTQRKHTCIENKGPKLTIGCSIYPNDTQVQETEGSVKNGMH